MNKSVLYIIIIILCIAGIAAVFISSGSAAKEAAALPSSPPTPSPTPIPTPEPKPVEIISTELIREELINVGQLTTQQYFFTEVVSYSSANTFFNTNVQIPFSQSSYLVSYDGVVSAGINFASASIEADGKNILIHLPDAEILSTDIDPESFVLYNEKEGIFNKISVSDFNESLVALEANAREKAVEKGILERADENAKSVVLNFLSGIVGIAEYKITIA